MWTSLFLLKVDLIKSMRDYQNLLNSIYKKIQETFQIIYLKTLTVL